VQNIRDAIIETVSYRAAQARYKIFIIDEVHMLSTSAFNALLKTLEEPPAHVKFLFATTEIRKVPVTVLSRCQRFDLRRIEPEVMIAPLKAVAAKEGAEIAEEALALITRASEGSVRDAMSLLDQAIAHGAGETGADQVRAMLGLADRGRVLDLFEAIMGGDAAGALAELGGQYADGADPVAVLRDLAEVTHWLSVVKITPDAAEDPTIGAGERARGQELSERLPMRALTRMWQMLLKALEEVRLAPNAMMAAEMAMIRLTHVADLPTPGDLVKKLTEAPPSRPWARLRPRDPRRRPRSHVRPRHRAHPGARPRRAPRPRCSGTRPRPRALSDMGQRRGAGRRHPRHEASDRGEILPPPRVLRPRPDRAGAHRKRPARPREPAQARAAGGDGRASWVLTIGTGGAPTINGGRGQAKAALTAEVEQHPLMQAIRTPFPRRRSSRSAPAPRSPGRRGRGTAGTAGRQRHARGLGPVRGLTAVAAKRGLYPALPACDDRPRGVSGTKPPPRG
jgi:DNA polymerase-3 subunit gamma/tau